MNRMSQRIEVSGPMLPEAERDLLAGITRQIESMDSEVHDLQRRKRVLRDAATQLRLGRPASIVQAEIAAALKIGPQ